MINLRGKKEEGKKGGTEERQTRKQKAHIRWFTLQEATMASTGHVLKPEVGTQPTPHVGGRNS